MSIFRDTFTKEIQDSINIRQNAMANRTPQSIQYLNSRNAWIRMTSAVNVNGTNTLAKQYVLLGGTLNQNTVTLPSGAKVDAFTPKAGVDYNDPSKAYSSKTPSGKTHRLGIRPMPGITSIDVKSLTAYGSLREVTVNFQCWDIAQLEELELLYMRPGYTVLIEWGWLPYLWKDSNGNTTLQKTLPEPFYDILNKPATNRTKIFRELFNKSKKSGGNYDAMYGYIKNYQWSARADGGYDCQTTVISTGEIIESLKVNYVSPDLAAFNDPNYTGLLNDEFSNQGNTNSSLFASYYQKNILAGLWAETYIKLLDGASTLSSNSVFKDKFARFNFNGITQRTSDLYLPTTSQGATGSQVYITLEAAFDVMNKYVVPFSNSGNKESLITLSLTSSTITNTTSSDLYCIAHPVQVSANPSVCLINSPLWSDKGQIVTAISGAAAASPLSTKIQDIVDNINAALNSTYTPGGLSANQNIQQFVNAVSRISNIQEFDIVETALGKQFQDIINKEYPDKKLTETTVTPSQSSTIVTFNLKNVIDHITSIQGLTVTPVLNSSIRGSGRAGTTITTVTLTSITITGNSLQSSSANLVSLLASGQATQALATLNLSSIILKPFFYNSDPYTEIGIIKNIYVNVEFLYKKALDGFIESQDTKEKNEINLYNYVKSIIREIQSALGNLTNFEIHVDPVDNNVARVIDVNYTQPDKAKKNKLFELQVHNLKSVVRNYSLQSKIFPNQSSLIAIGSQAKGGQLGMQNNTMIDFNKTLTDRITPEKIFGGEDSLTIKNNTTPVAGNLAGIIKLYSALSIPPSNNPNAPNSGAPTPTSTDAVNFDVLYSTAKNNLRDLIVYFQSIPDLKSTSANRNIIPIQFSFEMDGIGGLVIGHLFTINQDVLPVGYKGSNLAQTVTRIGHTINNNDWVTKVEALNIVLNDKSGSINFQNLNLTKIITESLQGAFSSNLPTGPGAVAGIPCNYFPNYTVIPGKPSTLKSADIINQFKATNLDKKLIAKALIIGTLEQGLLTNSGVIYGDNFNYFGIQADLPGGAKWSDPNKVIIGCHTAIEGGTGCTRYFVSFGSLENVGKFMISQLTNKGFNNASTAEKITDLYIDKWWSPSNKGTILGDKISPSGTYQQKLQIVKQSINVLKSYGLTI
jgi:hypothetical protein